MTGGRWRRRTVLGLIFVVLAALAGMAGPATAASATPAPAATGADKPSPKPCNTNAKKCPTDTPTPTDGTSAPPPTDPSSAGALSPGAAVPGASNASGRPVTGPGPIRPDASPDPAAPGQQPGGSAAADPTGGATQRPASVSWPTVAGPIWPILWGGAALLALGIGGLLLALRDKGPRPPVAAAAGLGDETTDPPGDMHEPDWGVPSPRHPIRLEWIEPPD